MADDSSDARVIQMLKHAVGMAAAAGAFKGLQFIWTRVTGKEVPLGRAVAWTLVMGAAITTARMIAIRYTSKLLRSQQESMTESAAAALADSPDSSAV